MTTEQAADRLGVLAVTWPKMLAPVQRQVYDQLSAVEQEAVRVLFDYDDGQVHEPEAPAAIQAPPEVLEALRRLAQKPKAEPKRKAEPTPTPAAPPAAAASDAKLGDYLRQLAEELDHRCAPAPLQPPMQPPRPAAPPRPKVNYVAQLDDYQRARPATPPLATPAPRPMPRPKLELPPFPAPAPRPAALQRRYLSPFWATCYGWLIVLLYIALVLAIPAILLLAAINTP